MKRETKQIIVGGTTTREAVDVLKKWTRKIQDQKIYRESLNGYRNWIGKDRSVNNPSEYSFTKELKEVENADWIAVVGSDVRKEAPLLNVRILKTKKRNNARVIWFGSPSDLNYPLENGGISPQKWQDFLEGRHPACSSFRKAQRPWILMGTGVQERADVGLETGLNELQKVNENVNWGMIQSKPNEVGLLDMGLSTSYPVRVPSFQSIQGRMWILPDHYGNTLPLDADFKQSEILHTTHMPNYPMQSPLRTYWPAKAWCEKPGSWMNMEGRMQFLEPSLTPYFDAKDETTMLSDFTSVSPDSFHQTNLQESSVQKTFLKKVEFGKTGTLKSTYEKKGWNNYPIRTWMQGFYQTDLITSRSKTLSKCMRVLNQPTVDQFYTTSGLCFL